MSSTVRTSAGGIDSIYSQLFFDCLFALIELELNNAWLFFGRFYEVIVTILIIL